MFGWKQGLIDGIVLILTLLWTLAFTILLFLLTFGAWAIGFVEIMKWVLQ